MHAFRADLALALTSGDSLSGVLLMGPKVSEEKLASEEQELQVRKKNILNIWVNATGDIMLAEEIVSVQQIEPEVKRRILENPLLIVSLKADRETDYNTFIQVLDELKKADAQKISLVEPD